MPALFPQAINQNPIVNLRDDVLATVCTGGLGGTKVLGMSVYNQNVDEEVLTISISDGINSGDLFKVTVPGLTSMNLFDPIVFPAIADDGSYIIGHEMLLQVKAGTATPSLDIVCESADY